MSSLDYFIYLEGFISDLDIIREDEEESFFLLQIDEVN